MANNTTTPRLIRSNCLVRSTKKLVFKQSIYKIATRSSAETPVPCTTGFPAELSVGTTSVANKDRTKHHSSPKQLACPSPLKWLLQAEGFDALLKGT